MKRKIMFFVLMLALVFTVPAYATDYDFFGTIPYHNTVLSWQVTTGASAVTVFTSSWDNGNFDPMLAVWDSTGNKVYQQDDGGLVGSTSSNGISYDYSYWDTYYNLNLGAGTYTLTLATFYNWASGSNLSNPLFAYANDTPIPISVWTQPANHYAMGDYYAVHFLNATSVIPTNPVPEPCAMILFGTGIAGAAGFLRRRSKKN